MLCSGVVPVWRRAGAGLEPGWSRAGAGLRTPDTAGRTAVGEQRAKPLMYAAARLAGPSAETRTAARPPMLLMK